MKLGVVLPTVKIFGGVKRFLELGNAFIERGHRMVVYSPEGNFPSWFDFKGECGSFDELPTADLDVLFFTQHDYLEPALSASCKRLIFYHLVDRTNLKPLLAHRHIEVFANSTNVFNTIKSEYKVEAFRAFGGIDASRFPVTGKQSANDGCFTVLTYGRLNRMRKGTRHVVRACELLSRFNPRLKLLLFDSPVDEKARRLVEEFRCGLPFEFIVDHPPEKNAEIFTRADVFVSAEKGAGWANTCAEAMACGIPVIATRSGTRDFLIHGETGLAVWRNPFSLALAINKLIKHPELADKLARNGAQKIREFDWQELADRILHYLESEPRIYLNGQ